jgi:hypothetical protein
MKTSQFIQKSNEIHNGAYSYSLTEYINVHTKVKIICSIHGIFEQTPNNHANNKRGCPKCGMKLLAQKSGIAATKAANMFVEKAVKVHGDKYDYSLVNYINNNTKVKIICKIHGIFEQSPAHHLRKTNCSKCKGNSKLTTQQFIDKANAMHNNKYDYSMINYKNNKTKIKIICLEHGEFEQTPNRHLGGDNCPICKESRGEKDIAEWLEQRNIIFIREKRIKEFNPRKAFDFYLPNHDLYIEYDGKMHFLPSFNKNRFEKQQERDQKRNLWCKENNIKLEIITYLDNIEEKLLIICSAES